MLTSKQAKLSMLLSSRHLSMQLKRMLSTMSEEELWEAVEAIDKWLTQSEKKHSSGVRSRAGTEAPEDTLPDNVVKLRSPR